MHYSFDTMFFHEKSVCGKDIGVKGIGGKIGFVERKDLWKE